MPEWSKFSEKEIRKIETKLNEGFDKATIFILVLSPFICMIAPYLPSKKAKKLSSESIGYEKSLLLFSLFWFGMLLFVWIREKYKMKKQFSKNRKFLRRKIKKTIVRRKSKTAFSFFENTLITELEGNLCSIKIDKKKVEKINIGEEIQIEYEEQTNTILKVETIITL